MGESDEADQLTKGGEAADGARRGHIWTGEVVSALATKGREAAGASAVT